MTAGDSVCRVFRRSSCQKGSGPLVVYVEYGDFQTVFLGGHGKAGGQCSLADAAFLACNAKDGEASQCVHGRSYKIIDVYMCKHI